MLSLLISCLTLLAFDAVLFVHAGLFVVNPQQGSTCSGGQPCTVDWLDDGQTPLLTAIGKTTVGLYTGHQRLVQAIQVVDVSSSHSITFTPLPEAGPNSANYYISFVSVDLKNNSVPYSAFSPFFRLDKMTGSLASPNPSATASFSALPSTSTTGLTTVTVGTLSTSTTSSSRVRSTTSTVTTSTSKSSQSTTSPTPTSPVLSGFTTSVISTPLVSPSSSATVSPSLSTSPTAVNTSGAVWNGVSTKRLGLSATLVAFGLVLLL